MNKIDLVYLWCSDRDPVWREKRRRFQPQTAAHEDDVCEGRWFDNDELKYSLRSVEQFAPWLNHIFIVSDHQTPEWLNTDHPKITMVNHEDFMPPESLPVFNPRPLEMRLDRIPGLSEHFIFANDDMLFGAPVRPGDFFTRKGLMKMHVVFKRTSMRYYLHPEKFDKHCAYINAQFAMRYKIYKRFGVRCRFIPHHNIDAYTRTDIRAAADLYPEVRDRTLLHKFREDDDWDRSLVEYYAWIRRRAVRRFVTLSFMRNRANYVLGRICKMLAIPVVTSVLYNVGQKWDGIDRMLRLGPKFFCINDGSDATMEDRKRIHRFFETAFPRKSSFEK